MPNGFLLATDAILKLKPAFEDFLQFACSDLILSFFLRCMLYYFKKSFICLLIYLATRHGIWYSNSPTRYQTHNPYSESANS